MEIDDLTRLTGEWLRGEGPLAEVVISSRIRLARNLETYPFLSKTGESERRELFRSLTECVAETELVQEGLLVNLEEADPLDRQLLVERHLISNQLCEAEGCRGAVISADETRALMINEEDHLRLSLIHI